MICTRFIFTCSLIFLLFVAVYIPFSQASAQFECSSDMSNRAESLLINASDDWNSLFKHKEIFASCDDGALGEGYSEAVVQLFAQRWEQLGIFVVLAKNHPSFQRWAIRHIDATALDEDLNKIVFNATACIATVAAANVCKSIERAAAEALMESERTKDGWE